MEMGGQVFIKHGSGFFMRVLRRMDKPGVVIVEVGVQLEPQARVGDVISP